MSDKPAEQDKVIDDTWLALRRHTAARIALGRSGASLPTRELLAFGAAHAQARDAVHDPLDVEALSQALVSLGLPLLQVTSAAEDRAAYLVRPDWGRRLSAASRASVEQARSENGFDLVFVITDGLSATGVQQQAPGFLAALLPLLADRYSIAPLVIAWQGRVALADEVGDLLQARLALSLIGERPGLSSADSLGVYITWAPKIGRSDAERNCISNVRPRGLALDQAARQTAALIRAALDAGTSGVALRFDAGSLPALTQK